MNNTGTITVKANLEPPFVGMTFTVEDFGKCEVTEVKVAEQGLPFYDLCFKTLEDPDGIADGWEEGREV